MGWARFVFIVGNYALAQTFAFYDPIIRDLAANGTKVLLVLLQDTYWGTGPWNDGSWAAFTAGFSARAGEIAAHYKGQVTAYEIWNEQDNISPSSIYIAPENYAPLLAATAKAIHAADKAAKVVSGGLASGNPIGYLTAVRTACGGVLPCDAIGFHPYGKTPPNTAVFDWQSNTLAPALKAVYSAFSLPIWITEIGVPEVDVNNQALWPVIGTYMRNTFTLIHSTLWSIAPVLIWFGWSDSMDSAGIVHDNQSHKGVIWDAFAANVQADSANPNPPLLPEPPVEPIPPVVTMDKPIWSLIGAYLMQGGEWLLAVMLQLVAIGKPLSAVVNFRLGWGSEADPGAIKNVSPDTIVIERWYWSPNVDWSQPDLKAVGAEMLIDYYNTFHVSLLADYIYIVNEPMPGPGTASFWMGAMTEAEKRGLHLCVGNFPETWPALPDELESNGQPKYFRQFWTLPEVHKMIEQVIKGGHCLSWHEYIIADPGGPWDQGWSMGRCDKVLALLPANLQHVKIVLTEWGTGMSQAMSDDQIVRGFSTGDKFLHNAKADVRAVAWCVGPWTDSAHSTVNSDLGYHRAALVKYWNNARF